jgi:hypothetical protein
MRGTRKIQRRTAAVKGMKREGRGDIPAGRRGYASRDARSASELRRLVRNTTAQPGFNSGVLRFTLGHAPSLRMTPEIVAWQRTPVTPELAMRGQGPEVESLTGQALLPSPPRCLAVTLPAAAPPPIAGPCPATWPGFLVRRGLRACGRGPGPAAAGAAPR